MKYPFKFKHYTNPMIVYTADKSLSGEIEVSWENSLRAGLVRYTLDQVKTNIDNGTWEIIEEETPEKEPKMKSITENIKIKVNPEQSAIVQEICFKNGIDWSKYCLNKGPAKSVKFAKKPYLLIDVESVEGINVPTIYWQTEQEHKNSIGYKEYTFEQFVQEFGEQPVKEDAKETLEKQSKPRKHAELIKAWADGAIIQYYSRYNRWYDCVDNIPGWDDDTEYRIKPAEPEKEETVKVMIYSNKGHLISITESILSEAQEFINKHSNNTL